MTEYVLVFQGFGSEPSWCHVVISNGDASQPDVLVGELEDNPGTTVRNATEEVARSIKRQLVPQGKFKMYEYSPRGLPQLRPTFYEISWHAPRFSMPTWEVVDPDSDHFLRRAKKLVKTTDYTAQAIRARKAELIDGRDDTAWTLL